MKYRCYNLVLLCFLVRSPNKRESHNASEKRRAERIRIKIEELRSLLEGDGRDCRRDKFSVLDAVHAYMIELRQRAGLGGGVPVVNGSVPAVPGPSVAGTLGQLPHNDAASVLHSLRSSTPAAGTAGSAPPAPLIPSVALPMEPYASVFELAPVAMALAAPDGSFRRGNALFRALTGYDSDQLRSASVFSLTPQSELDSMFHVVSKLIAKGKDSRRRPGGGAGGERIGGG